VVSSSDDRTVRVWDAKTGKQKHVMRGHEGIVMAAAFSPNGQMIVSGSADCTVRVWSSATGMQQHVMNGHDKGVRLCTFSPDNRYIVSGSSDYTLRLWDVTTGIQQCVMNGHAGRVNSVTFSRDGKLVISSSNDYTIRIWDAVTGAQYHTMHTGGLGEVRSVAFYVDTGRFISVSYDWDRNDHAICAWDLRVTTGPEPLYMRGHEGTINSVVISGNNRFMMSGSSDCTIRLFSFGDAQLTTLNLHESSVNSVTVSPDNQSIISGSDDCTVLVWDISEGTRQDVISNHEGQVTTIAFSPTGQLVVAGFHDGTIRMWNVATGTQQHTMIGHEFSIHSVAFSPDGDFIASASRKDIRVWDTATGAQRHVFDCIETGQSVAFSFDNQHVVSAWTGMGLRNIIRDMADKRDMADPIPLANSQPLIEEGLLEARALVWNASSGAKLDRDTVMHEDIVATTLRLVRSVPDTPYILDDDGWVSYRVARGVKKRLCWLPGERRGRNIASHGQKVCIGASSGAITILDFSNVAYV
jgi:WD40 repeat protein